MTQQDIKILAQLIQPLLALVLYLCSDEPDIIDREQPQEKPTKPQPKRTKRGWRLFPPNKPRVWHVADNIGATLRTAYGSTTEPTGRTVRPHLRRAHWHGFWLGARDADDRQFRYKWLPPTVVASPPDEA